MPSSKQEMHLRALCSSLSLKHKGVVMPPGDASSVQMDGCWRGSRAEVGGNEVLQDLPSPFTSCYELS